MSQTERRHFGGQEKVKILRMHLLEGKPVSDLCEQHKINPSLDLARTACLKSTTSWQDGG